MNESLVKEVCHEAYFYDIFLWLKCLNCAVSVYRLPDAFCFTVDNCRDFVWKHRNVLDGMTRIYLVSREPIVFKEIGISPSGERCYWVWVFRVRGGNVNGYYYVIKFSGRPSRDEISRVINLICFEKN